MAHFKLVQHDYSPNADFDVIKYICNPKKAQSLYIGGINVSTSSVVNTVTEFKILRKIFGKENGRLLRHYIISFEANEHIVPFEAFKMAYDIASFYGDFQTVFAVHEDTQHLHVHFLMNTVSIVDGKKFSEGPDGFYRFKFFIDNRVREQ